MGRDGARRITSPIVVGREDESRLLDLALADVLQGHPRVVVVGGEAGVGKSRLVDDFGRRAGEQGARVVVGGCMPSGSAVPYLPFVEMLRTLVRELPAGRREMILGPARPQLARVMPELARLEPPSVATGSPREAARLVRLHLLEGLLEVAERLGADMPTVFVLEDTHWADEDSLGLVTYVARNLHRGRVMLVLTARTDEPGLPGSPMLRFLAELERILTVDRLELAPLSLAASWRQVEAILGHRVERQRVAAIYRLAGGNPFYTEELVASSPTEGPGEPVLSPRLRDVLAARIARLPQETREVLRVASVAGRALDDRILAAASGMSPAAVGRGLRTAVEEHVLVPVEQPGASGYRFRHELLRAAVAAELLPGERARLHCGVAIALADAPAAVGGAGEIAYHWDLAGEPARALPAHVDAALAAERACGYADAQRHFERALALWDQVRYADDRVGLNRLQLAEHASEAAAAAGDLARAIELGRAILAEVPAANADMRDRVQAGLRWHLWESGEYEAALTEAVAAVRRRPRGGPTRAHATALAHHAGLLMIAGQTAGARREAARALRLAADIPAREVEALALGVLGWCLAAGGRTDEAVERIREAWAIAQEVGDAAGQAVACNELAAILEIDGRTDEALSVALDGVAQAARRGLARTMGAMVESTAVRALYLLGRWDEARARATAALEAGAVGPGRAGLLAALALVSVGRGEFGEADRALGESREPGEGPTDQWQDGWLAAAATELLLWRGDPRAALLAMAGGAPAGPGGGLVGGAAHPVRDGSGGRLLALAAWAGADLRIQRRVAGGELEPDTAAALEALRRTLSSGGRRPPGTEPDILAARAEEKRGDGRDAAEVRAWSAAAQAATRSRPYAEAHARWRLAEALLRAHLPRVAAHAEVRAAHELASRLGAVPLAHEVELLARRARLPLAATEPPGKGEDRAAAGFGLTERERAVLVLVAAGCSNREIGERLFISPKTASVHVSNILGKLGVDGRVEAATLAHRLGLAEADATGS